MISKAARQQENPKRKDRWNQSGVGESCYVEMLDLFTFGQHLLEDLRQIRETRTRTRFSVPTCHPVTTDKKQRRQPGTCIRFVWKMSKPNRLPSTQKEPDTKAQARERPPFGCRDVSPRAFRSIGQMDSRQSKSWNRASKGGG